MIVLTVLLRFLPGDMVVLCPSTFPAPFTAVTVPAVLYEFRREDTEKEDKTPSPLLELHGSDLEYSEQQFLRVT